MDISSLEGEVEETTSSPSSFGFVFDILNVGEPLTFEEIIDLDLRMTTGW